MQFQLLWSIVIWNDKNLNKIWNQSAYDQKQQKLYLSYMGNKGTFSTRIDGLSVKQQAACQENQQNNR